MIKTLHYSANYHANDLTILEDTKHYYENKDGGLILLIDSDIDMTGLSDDLREELREGLKHKNYVFVLV